MGKFKNLVTAEDEAFMKRLRAKIEGEIWYGKPAPTTPQECEFLKFAIANSGDGTQQVVYADNRDTSKIYRFTYSNLDDRINPVPLEDYKFVRWATGHDL